MQMISNPYRGHGLDLGADVPLPSTNAAAVAALLAQCPAHGQTPLHSISLGGCDTVWVKDERARMGLGSFKALGAAYVIACDAVATGLSDLATSLAGRCYVTASAGNHGMSVAAGARVFGAQSVIYIAKTVPAVFAERLAALGADVRRVGENYAASMAAAQAAAMDEGLTLLSDSSWPGYMEAPHRLMEGYLQLASEAIEQCPDTPTHILLQAGVGGMAGAVAALSRARWGDTPHIIVIEPDAAAALYGSIAAGRFTAATGPDSDMGRLDCKEASLIALAGLSKDADTFVLITETTAAHALAPLAAIGLESSPSGAAGLAALLAHGADLGITAQSRVLTILSEGPA